MITDVNKEKTEIIVVKDCKPVVPIPKDFCGKGKI